MEIGREKEKKMEECISLFSESITSFCNHLQSSCDALNLSLDRRPIPLDSASSTFIKCLNRRVSATGGDLNLLESMSFGTISFEELLGHCNEVYKKNQSDLLQLHDRLKSSGYFPEVEIGREDEDSSISTPRGLETKDELDLPSDCRPLSATSSIMKSLEEDPLMDESLNLKSLGLSDFCLATLASEANSKTDDAEMFTREPVNHYGDKLQSPWSLEQTAEKTLGVIKGEIEGDLKPADAVRPAVEVSKDEYESLPSYMKSLAPWEDLLAATEKINSSLRTDKTKGSDYFHQDEIASLGLGPKARTYLLLLVRMNQLVVETIDGMISYKVLSTR